MKLCRRCNAVLHPAYEPEGICEDCFIAGWENKLEGLGQYREAVLAAIADHPNPQRIWERVLGELPGLMKARAIQLAGLAERQPRSDNTSGHVGIDRHRGRWRARVWRGGKVVYQRSHIDQQRAIDARARYLSENP